MTHKSYYFFLLLPLFPFNPADSTAQDHNIQLRMNMIGNHYENIANVFSGGDGFIIPVEDKKDINTHLFSFIGGEREEGRSSISHYSYYYLGMGYVKYFGKNNFFRIRIDRFSIDHKYQLYEIGNDPLNYSKYTEYYKSAISTMQYTAGAGKKISWKFLDFMPGFELLLHHRGDKEETKYITIEDTSGTNSYSSYVFYIGGNFIGLSLLGAVNINLSPHIGIGIEASAGIAGFNFNRLRVVFHYPSLVFYYKFHTRGIRQNSTNLPVPEENIR